MTDQKKDLPDLPGLLSDWYSGNEMALDLIFANHYKSKFLPIAYRLLAKEKKAYGVKAEDLVAKVFINLKKDRKKELFKPNQFWGVVRHRMKRELVDMARARNRVASGGRVEFIKLDRLMELAEGREES